MSASWSERIASTQILIVYPILSANISHHQNNWAFYFSIFSIFFVGILVNYIFINDLRSILTTTKNLRELYKEYAWVLLVALINILIFSYTYHMFGIKYESVVIKGDWYNSIYFSIVTWTTLGYGDFLPVENLRLVAALQAIMGYFYMAFLVGLLLNISNHTMRPKLR
ncbi:potassium channel family protein [Pseudoalteromonas rhizosphaerae]|uniref:potassium channel family protein n=1 Tax=Pseudoalteromonas rhizosphaerae TaxID=2518973 RepID=UPI00384FAF70